MAKKASAKKASAKHEIKDAPETTGEIVVRKKRALKKSESLLDDLEALKKEADKHGMDYHTYAHHLQHQEALENRKAIMEAAQEQED
jgi:predicted DNA binding CopG/RHH family protein